VSTANTESHPDKPGTEEACHAMYAMNFQEYSGCLLCSPNSVSAMARPQTIINYYFTLSAAKKIAVIENNKN
jgi:hypothetical protein